MLNINIIRGILSSLLIAFTSTVQAESNTELSASAEPQIQVKEFKTQIEASDKTLVKFEKTKAVIARGTAWPDAEILINKTPNVHRTANGHGR